MFNWLVSLFKKKPEPIIIVKEEHVIEILDLADAYDRSHTWKDSFALWSRINELYPEVKGRKATLAVSRGELCLKINE